MKRDGWILKHKKTGDPVAVGEKITDHRGLAAYVCGGVPPETKRGTNMKVKTQELEGFHS